MRRTLILLISLIILIGCVQAALIVDQNQSLKNDGEVVGSVSGSNYGAAQSFVPNYSNLVDIEIWKLSIGMVGTPTGNYTIQLRTDSAGSPSSTILASKKWSVSELDALGDGMQFTNITYTLTPGTPYWIVAIFDSTSTGDNYRGIGCQNTGNPYPTEKISSNFGSTWSTAANRALTFRTWANVTPPTSSFTENKTGGLSPVAVQFNDTSLNTPNMWNWSVNSTDWVSRTWFNSTTRYNLTYTFTDVGIHNVSLTVSNSTYGTPSSTSAIDIYVNESVISDFGAAPTSGYATLDVSFVDMSSPANIYAWYWDFGDNQDSTTRNPTHSYNSSGIYTVKLTATSPDGSDTEIKTNYITVSESADLNPDSTLRFKPNGNIINNQSRYNMTIQLFNVTNTSFISGTITLPASTLFVTKVYANRSTFTDNTLISSTINNNTGTVSWNVSRTDGFNPGTTPASIVDIEMFQKSYATGNFTQSPGSADLGNITYNTTHPISHAQNASFTYGAWVTYSNFTISKFYPIIYEDTVTFTPVGPLTADRWLWNFGDGQSFLDANGTAVTHKYNSHYSNQSLSPSLMAYVSTNASVTNTSTLSISPVLNVSYIEADFTGSPTSGSSGLNVLFTDHSAIGNGSVGVQYNWSFGDDGLSTSSYSNTVGSVNHVYGYLGTYTVKLTISNSLNSSTLIRSNYIVISNNQQTQTTFYSPHQVAFQILDSTGNPIANTPITAHAIQSTLPGGLSGALTTLQNAYGVPLETAQEMLSNTTEYSGTTDTYGYSVILMLSTIKYQVNVTDTTGAIQTTTVMPQDSYYQIRTYNSTTSDIFQQAVSSSNIYNGESVFNTSFTKPNSSYGTMIDYIYDATGKTAGANCWFTCVDNGTTWWDNRTWAYGSTLQTISMTVPIVPYQQWKWGCTTI